MSTSIPDIYQRPDLSRSPYDRVLAVYNVLVSGPATSKGVTFTSFDILPLKYARLTSVTVPTPSSPGSGSTTWSFTCAPELCNRGGNLHGGCAATLLDSLTSTALLTIARPGFLDGGHVSRTLSCTYLRPVPLGEECVVECWIVAAGKRTAHVRGEIRLKDGKIAVACAHDKAVLPREEPEAKL